MLLHSKPQHHAAFIIIRIKTSITGPSGKNKVVY